MVKSTVGFRKSGRTWKPKQTSAALLVADIAASIREHRSRGVERSASDYTSDGSIIAAVNAIL